MWRKFSLMTAYVWCYQIKNLPVLWRMVVYSNVSRVSFPTIVGLCNAPSVSVSIEGFNGNATHLILFWEEVKEVKRNFHVSRLVLLITIVDQRWICSHSPIVRRYFWSFLMLLTQENEKKSLLKVITSYHHRSLLKVFLL